MARNTHGQFGGWAEAVRAATGTGRTTRASRRELEEAAEKAFLPNKEQELSGADAARYSAERNAAKEREAAAEKNPGGGGFSSGPKPIAQTDTGTSSSGRTAATAVEEEKKELERSWADVGGLGGGRGESSPRPTAQTDTGTRARGNHPGSQFSGWAEGVRNAGSAPVANPENSPKPTRQTDTATGARGGTFLGGDKSATTTQTDKQRINATYKGSESEKAIKQNDEQERSAVDAARYSASRKAQREREATAEENPGGGGFSLGKPKTTTGPTSTRQTDTGTRANGGNSHTVGAENGILGGSTTVTTPTSEDKGKDKGKNKGEKPAETRTMTKVGEDKGSDKGKDKGSNKKKGNSRHREGYTKYMVGGRTFWVKN